MVANRQKWLQSERSPGPDQFCNCPKWMKNLVPPTRIERATRGLGNRCSIQLSYGGVWDAEKDPCLVYATLKGSMTGNANFAFSLGRGQPGNAHLGAQELGGWAGSLIEHPNRRLLRY